MHNDSVFLRFRFVLYFVVGSFFSVHPLTAVGQHRLAEIGWRVEFVSVTAGS